MSVFAPCAIYPCINLYLLLSQKFRVGMQIVQEAGPSILRPCLVSLSHLINVTLSFYEALCNRSAI